MTPDDQCKVKISRIVQEKWLMIDDLEVDWDIDIAPVDDIYDILFEEYMIMN